MKLIYIIGTYPLLTTTFIDREIRILRRWGIDIEVVSIRRPLADAPLSEAQKTLLREVLYLFPINWVNLLLSHCYFLLRSPKRLLQTTFHLLTRPHVSWKSRLKTMLHIGEGVYTAFLVRDRSFQELHAHFVDRAATVALVVGQLLDKPFSLSIHAGADIFVKPVLLAEKIAAARHAATCTQYNKQHIESLVGRDLTKKITHIKHGLELEKYQPLVTAECTHPIILAVGQLAPRKGFTQLIEACHQLKNDGFDFTCRIIGKGDQEQYLLELIKELGLDGTVILCGALPHDEVINCYQEATFFVLPCVQSRAGNLDGIPNVLAEAMAMRLPVVSTTVSAIPELVENEKTGLLVSPNDVAALVTVMKRLLVEPELRLTLGEQARQAVLEMFDVEYNVRQFAMTLWPEWIEEYGNSTAT